MMVLYSGTTCPFSHRCRFVLFEKGMDFEIRDVDLYNKPEDINVMNPYGQVPILVERDLILYESNIINEYIDDRFPHPQLIPADPVMPARARASSLIRPCVVVEGCVIVVLVSPRLAVIDNSRVPSITFHARSRPPLTTNDTMAPPVFWASRPSALTMRRPKSNSTPEA